MTITTCWLVETSDTPFTQTEWIGIFSTLDKAQAACDEHAGCAVFWDEEGTHVITKLPQCEGRANGCDYICTAFQVDVRL